MKIGITGYLGVLGSILVRKLTEQNLPFSCFKGDLRNRCDIQNWLSSRDVDVVIHLAAVVPTVLVKDNPLKAFDVNVGGTINLLQEIVKLDMKVWFFYASTSHVYKSSISPIKESDEIYPVSLYGKTKQMAEYIALESGKVSNCHLDVCVGRIFSFYHKTQKPPFLYPNLMRRLTNEDLAKPFVLHGADSVRDFLNAEEVVDKIILIMRKRAIGIYNIASGRGVKIGDFVQSLTPTPLTIISQGESDYLVADTTKFEREIK